MRASEGDVKALAGGILVVMIAGVVVVRRNGETDCVAGDWSCWQRCGGSGMRCRRRWMEIVWMGGWRSGCMDVWR